MPNDKKEKKDKSGLKKITEFAKSVGKNLDKDTIQCKSPSSYTTTKNDQ